ncbi:hypothetical protein GCM10007079_08980 [Nocardiopsis terrae]|nr:hypothetical protein GCM10007079_08980 [Nocardiopsis terrae]
MERGSFVLVEFQGPTSSGARTPAPPIESAPEGGTITDAWPDEGTGTARTYTFGTHPGVTTPAPQTAPGQCFLPGVNARYNARGSAQGQAEVLTDNPSRRRRSPPARVSNG